MPFVKGQPGGPGRPKGAYGIKKRLKRSLEEIANGWHPIDELIQLLPQITDIQEKAKILLEMAPYFEARKGEVKFSVTQAQFGHTDLSKLSDEEVMSMVPTVFSATYGLSKDKVEEFLKSEQQTN